jgi:uncharacterized protein YyaL (SSP411 family)
VAGRAGAADTRALAREFERRFLPGDLLLVMDDRNRGRLAGILPFAAEFAPAAGFPPAAAGRATAYVCVGHACHAPVTEPRELGAMLDEDAQP